MKKITFLLAALFMGGAAISQSVIIDRLPDHDSALVATQGEYDEGIYAADYFKLTEETTLGEATFFGFRDGAIEPEMISFNVYIFESYGTHPYGNPEDAAEAVLELKGLTGDKYELFEHNPGATQYNQEFTVKFTHANDGAQVTLPAGEYWIAAFPTTQGEPDGGGQWAGRWNWQGSNTGADYKPVLIDPSGFFTQLPEWTIIEELIEAPFPSFGWILKDEAHLSVGDNLVGSVSVFPNPSSDVFNITLPSNVEVLSSSLVDVLGKTTGVVYSNGQMNVSTLAPGVYFLSLETNLGSYNQKVVVKQ